MLYDSSVIYQHQFTQLSISCSLHDENKFENFETKFASKFIIHWRICEIFWNFNFRILKKKIGILKFKFLC